MKTKANVENVEFRYKIPKALKSNFLIYAAKRSVSPRQVLLEWLDELGRENKKDEK